jgi:hypothetical protein
MANGEFLARMDHDDISLPDRLAQQVEHIQHRPNVDVVGTWAKTFGRQPDQTWRYPTKDRDIRSEFIFSSVLVHSSVMLRKSTFDRLSLRYDSNVAQAQDYELWTRAAPLVRFANIGKVLMHYRLHDKQVGRVNGVEQQATAEGVRERQITALGLQPTPKELALHHRISRWQFPKGYNELIELRLWFIKMLAANQLYGAYPTQSFQLAVGRRWWAACQANINLGWQAWNLALSVDGGLSLTSKAHFLAKASIRQLGWRAK